eukprot:8801099-Pyramimonas_sp.AAC.1
MEVRKVSTASGSLPSTLVVYKLVGSEAGILDYYTSCARGGRSRPVVQAHDGARTDWSALYTQFTMPHSINTASYRFEAGYAQANLARAEIDSSAFSVYLVNDSSSYDMANPSIQSSVKADRIKELLHIPQSSLLMDELGKWRSMLICRESAKEFELIIPHQLLQDPTTSIFLREEIVSSFKPNTYMALARRQDGESGEWYDFDYTEVAKMDNDPPQFIVDALNK